MPSVAQPALMSPVVYSGNKKPIAQDLWRWFGRCENFIDPFVGGGAALINRPSGLPAQVNDLSPLVANLWRSIQADPAGIQARILTPEQFRKRAQKANDCCTEFDLRPLPAGHYDVSIAAMFVMGKSLGMHGRFPSARKPNGKPGRCLLRYKSGGGLYSYMGCYAGYRHMGTYSKRGVDLAGISDTIQGVHFECGDFVPMLQAALNSSDRQAVLLDPPYVGYGRYYYNREWTRSQASDVVEAALELGRKVNNRVAYCEYHSDALSEKFKREGWVECWWHRRAATEDRERVWFSPFCRRPMPHTLTRLHLV